MIKSILNILSFTEYDIIGSYDDPNINNNVISDIDAQEFKIFDNNSIRIYNEILEHFKNIFKKFKNNKRVVITDFKCGIGKANVPYRWEYKDIQRGYQYDDQNNKIYFINQLEKQSIIKIDILLFVNNEFIEITMNYYFNLGNNKSFKEDNKNDILINLHRDAKDYRNDGNYYKSLKRLNSYYKILEKSNKKLLELINSNYGRKSKQKALLEGLLYAMENKGKFNKKDIKSANLDNLTKDGIKEKIDQLDKEINSEELLKLINKYKLY